METGAGRLFGNAFMQRQAGFCRNISSECRLTSEKSRNYERKDIADRKCVAKELICGLLVEYVKAHVFHSVK